MLQIVFERQWHRFQILFEIYKRSNADIDTAYDLRELSLNHGMKFLDFLPAWKYLQMEDLIRVRFRQSSNKYYACMTHQGLKAIEEVFFNENKPTYYFPAYREMSV